MTDTHRVTERTYTVVERVYDCDHSCSEDTGVRPEATISWEGLPPSLVMSPADYKVLLHEMNPRLKKTADGRYVR